jgi:hypothetical protein
MRWWRIPDGDSLFRHSIFPVSFKGRRFSWEKCLTLYDEPDGSILASLTWERYVPTTELVHGYGCRLAFRRNEKKRAEGRFKEKDRQVYCGAYQLKGNAIRGLAVINGLDQVLSADVIHRIEEGEIAHTDLKIVLRAGGGVEGTKTAILDRLWNTCSGPLKHICDCDTDIDTHPSLGLPTAPAGPYYDSRSYLLRLWYIVRFRICNWLWVHFQR